jgi:hypothetical protein
MKPINTIPIETFLERVRIANKTNQKSVSLDIKDASVLADTINIIMSRLIMKMSSETEPGTQAGVLKINADGGDF